MIGISQPGEQGLYRLCGRRPHLIVGSPPDAADCIDDQVGFEGIHDSADGARSCCRDIQFEECVGKFTSWSSTRDSEDLVSRCDKRGAHVGADKTGRTEDYCASYLRFGHRVTAVRSATPSAMQLNKQRAATLTWLLYRTKPVSCSTVIQQ